MSFEPGTRVVFEWDFWGGGEHSREVFGRVLQMLYHISENGKDTDPARDEVRVLGDDAQAYIVPVARVHAIAEQPRASAVERIAAALEFLCLFAYDAADHLPGVWDLPNPPGWADGDDADDTI